MKQSDKTKTIVITVASLDERDKIIRRIYTNLHKEPSTQFTVIQPQVNKIQIFHNVGKGVRLLIRTYLVFVVPVNLNLKPLNEVYGLVDFHLDETIKKLRATIVKLKALQGQRFVPGIQRKDVESALTEIMGNDYE